MSETWVLVANSSSARFFILQSRHEPLLELEGMVHSEGRMREQDEVTDRQGSIAGGHGEGAHNFESPDLKQHEAEVFARQIAHKLELGRTQNDYHKLVIVASPAFLGVLRQVLNNHVLDLVSVSLDKNLVEEDESVIREHILAVS